jgi:hypothetical protein
MIEAVIRECSICGRLGNTVHRKYSFGGRLVNDIVEDCR